MGYVDEMRKRRAKEYEARERAAKSSRRTAPKPGVALVRYDAARKALADASRVDEVKDIRDRAQAMAAYARQAKDTELVEWATEIKVRAERRAGELLRDMAETGGRAKQHDDRYRESQPATLADLGVNKSQASRWQQLAAVPEAQFERAVAAAKDIALKGEPPAPVRGVDGGGVSHVVAGRRAG